MLKILTILNGPIEENCYVLSQGSGSEAIVIDPGSSPEQLKKAMDSAGLKPVLILATHGHFDHVGAVHALAEAYGASLAMHPADQDYLDSLEDTYAFYGMGGTKKPSIAMALKDGDVIDKAGIQLKVIATPGHTPGGLCFYHLEAGSLFSGDTLFQRSIGRSDLPGGDHATLIKSIKKSLLILPDAVKVYPGHGDPTTIGEEKKENAFLK